MPSAFLPSLSETLKLRASIFFRLELAAPWGLALSETADLRVHIVKRGCCWLGGGSLGSPVELREGEIVLLSRGQEHWIADRPGRALTASDDAADSCKLGQPPFQEGRLTHKLICGQAKVHDRGGGWLLSLLPDVLHFRQDDLGDDRIWKVVEAINAKSISLEEDDSLVLDRLTEALFLCLLGRATQLELELGQFGAAHRDPQVRKTVVLMHTMLAESWTIQSLAERAGISRAALARRFKSALGMSVMDYLRQVRMGRAMQLLLDGADLGRVAAGIGYGSAEAFRKAFKRHTGLTPARYLQDSEGRT